MKNSSYYRPTSAQIDPAQLLDRITYRLLNHTQHSALLEQRPAVLMGDLCLLFQFDISENAEVSRTIPITNALLSHLNLSPRELMKLAKENTMRLQPLVIDTMEARLGLPPVSDETQPTLLIVTNPDNFYGAGSILYPGAAQQIAARLHTEEYLILPSSVHEVLAIPRYLGSDIAGLRAMVQEINETEVAPKDRLSDNIYELRQQRLLPIVT